VHYTGHLHDDLSLRALHSAADAIVIACRQNNLPNTGLEAHACSTPVVAFNTGGLPVIVADCITGAQAEPFEAASLAAAIRWVLEDPQLHQSLRRAARQRAEKLWNPARVSRLYQEVYHQAIECIKRALLHGYHRDLGGKTLREAISSRSGKCFRLIHWICIYAYQLDRLVKRQSRGA
jgi:glycogen synthase